MSLPIDELAAAMADPARGPFGSERPQWIQTHLSHVFLVGDRVFKLRKPVRFEFVDFGSREARNRDCVDEVALNRRLARDVYLGIAAVLPDDGGVCLGPVGDGIERPEHEHVVVMRRLPEGRDALSLLSEGRLAPEQLERVAERLVPFHRGAALEGDLPGTRGAITAAVLRPILACLQVLRSHGHEEVPKPRVDGIESTLRSRVAQSGAVFEARAREGRFVDGHGDLHLQHLWFEPGDPEPRIIDCLEFDPALRRIDVASEVAFLAMDLRYRGREDLAERFLAHYAACSGDTGLYEVVSVYEAYRALVRAKVAALAADEPELPAAQRADARASVRRHVVLAERLLAERAPSRRVLAVAGTIASGKSEVARRVAGRSAAVVLASDRLRKALAGAAPDASLADAPGAGAYRDDARERVYAALLDAALPVLASGRPVILDATWSRRRWRDLLADFASRRGLDARLLVVTCDPAEVERRLAARRARGGASDAGPEHLEGSLAEWEPPFEWPAERRATLATDEDPDLQEEWLDAFVAEWVEPGGP